MTTSVHKLYDFFEGQGEMHPAIIMDLFGYANWTSFMKSNRDNVLTLFLGLYKGLYYMGVTQKEIYRCFLQNKLDDLIHIKYSITGSGYYNIFCGKPVNRPNSFKANPFEEDPFEAFEDQMIGNPIKIGNTFLDLHTDDDKDDCVDKIKTSNEIVPLIYTIQPSYVRIKNSLTDIDVLISKKIKSYKEQDTRKVKNNSVFSITDKYVTIADVKKLLYKQEEKCYVCGDVVSVTSCEKPNDITDADGDGEDVLLRHIHYLMSDTTHISKCMYQFTLDRIDNKLPHNGDNVLICCQYCNCFGENDKYTVVDLRVCKVCPNKCHTLKRNDIKRTRREVPREEINQLILH
jgi:hypothetical protein